MSLFKNVLNVGMATAASRVMGFVRDVLVAQNLGTGFVADAFFVAFRLPNLFRRLFAEGAFNAAFVPLFTKKIDQDGTEEARSFAEEVMAIMFWWLAGFSALFMIAMPIVILALAPGFTQEPAKFDLTVTFTQICFPYLLCMSLLALLGGVLNSRGHFTVPAWAPVLLNAILGGSMILAGAQGYAGTVMAGYFLSWAVFVAGFAQLGLLLWAVRRNGMWLTLKRPRLTPNVRRMLSLGVPGLIAGGITQINLVIGTMIASTMPAAVSWLYYADRIYQFPLGMVGVAIGVVLLPELSRQMKHGSDRVNETQNRALELSLLLTLPATVALSVIAHPIIAGLFERGAFMPADTSVVATSLAGFALGLPAFVLIKVLSPAFFAREDTKRPMYFAAASAVLNIVFSVVLFPLFGPVGIAIATSLAGWANALLLWIVLWRRGDFSADLLLKRRLMGIVAASLAMGVALYSLSLLTAPYLGHAQSLLTNLAALSFLCGFGFAVYIAAVFIFGGVDLPALKTLMKRRKKNSSLETTVRIDE